MNEPLPRNIPCAFTWQEQFSCPMSLMFYRAAVCLQSRTLEPQQDGRGDSNELTSKK